MIKSLNLNDVLNHFEQQVDQMQDEMVMALQAACVSTVAAARSLNTYKDRTGNLRSSIGYVLYRDGMRVGESFEAKPAGESGAEGVDTARRVAETVSTENQGQLVAVLVAGMDYAVYVESRGFDVISGPMQQFTSLFEEYLKAVL